MTLLIYNILFVLIDSFTVGVSHGILLKHRLLFFVWESICCISQILSYETMIMLLNISRQSKADIASLKLTILAWHMLRLNESTCFQDYVILPAGDTQKMCSSLHFYVVICFEHVH